MFFIRRRIKTWPHLKALFCTHPDTGMVEKAAEYRRYVFFHIMKMYGRTV
jgi:hypothetical protein